MRTRVAWVVDWFMDDYFSHPIDYDAIDVMLEAFLLMEASLDAEGDLDFSTLSTDEATILALFPKPTPVTVRGIRFPSVLLQACRKRLQSPLQSDSRF